MDERQEPNNALMSLMKMQKITSWYHLDLNPDSHVPLTQLTNCSKKKQVH